MTTGESPLFYVFDFFLAPDNKMAGKRRIRESGPERLGDQDVGGYFRVRKSRAQTSYAKSFKLSLADTLFCFVLLKLRFIGEALRFPNIIQNIKNSLSSCF